MHRRRTGDRIPRTGDALQGRRNRYRSLEGKDRDRITGHAGAARLRLAASQAIKRPRSMAPGLVFSALVVGSGARAHPHHEAVEAKFGHLLPGERVIAKSHQAFMQFLERRVALVVLRVDLLRGVVAGLEDWLRK